MNHPSGVQKGPSHDYSKRAANQNPGYLSIIARNGFRTRISIQVLDTVKKTPRHNKTWEPIKDPRGFLDLSNKTKKNPPHLEVGLIVWFYLGKKAFLFPEWSASE